MIGRPANGRSWVLATVLAVALAGCGHGAKHTPSADASPTSILTTTTVDPKAKVVADYEAFWAAYLEAANPMNPEDPRLRAHATGTELQHVGSAFLARKGLGQIIKGTFDFAPIVSSVEADNAVLRDCYFDHTLVYVAGTGQPVGQPDTVRQLVTVRLVLDPATSTWKVSEITHEGSGCTSAS
ncbi:MAG TPA: hypothetical protein VFP54_12515 [Acidimicrobiales bacterium]|nr:hypothetical protein [Acidimicrobiales bacterium]